VLRCSAVRYGRVTTVVGGIALFCIMDHGSNSFIPWLMYDELMEIHMVDPKSRMDNLLGRIILLV
jgi:hypothetical protein